MDRFVCIRMTQIWGVDLSLYQFDWWSSWTIFLMNADRAIYGRYGTGDDNTIEGLEKALEGALDLHKKYPANKAELAGKVGARFPWKTPEAVPTIVKKGVYGPGRNNCIHCHHLVDAVADSLQDAGEPIPTRLRPPYPAPERIGVTLDPRERATVTKVAPDSPAAKAGLRPGDRIVRLARQPILSIADVQWVLYASEDTADLAAELDRAGEKAEALIKLRGHWRR